MHSSIEPNRSHVLLDSTVSLLIVLIFLFVAHWKGLHPQSLTWLKPDHRQHVGAEYNDIAKAIRNGRGFSDPFQCETGPTAWMPPVLPFLMAGLYWLEGDYSNMIFPWMVALQGLSTWCAAFLLMREARRNGCTVAGAAIAILVFAANFYQLFQHTHDTALLLLVVSMLWLGLTRLQAGKGFPQSEIWGGWGGFCSLCNPIIGATWIICTCWILRPKQNAKFDWSSLAIVLSCWMVVVSPWMIRNYYQFGKWFPIKSNGMYELWQSHCKDDDGVLDANSGSGHPWPSDGEQRARYKEVGEIAFIEEKGAEVRKAIRENPLGLLERIGNRAFAALVLYIPFSPIEEYHGGGWPVFFVRCVHPLPSLSIGLIGIAGTFPMERKAAVTMSMFGLLLLPYLLVSYYDRYSAVLVGLKMLLILYGWSALLIIAKQCLKRRESQEHSLARATRDTAFVRVGSCNRNLDFLSYTC